MELIFRPAVVLQCVNLSIVDDSVLESTEQFSVLLSTSDSGVIFANSSAAVIIFDNDSKYESRMYCQPFFVPVHFWPWCCVKWNA